MPAYGRVRKRAPRQRPAAIPTDGGLFPEWLEQARQAAEASPLFGLPERIQTMHKLYGATEGKTCRGCVHLHRYQAGGSWMKCHESFVSASESTDWRAKWPACGRYEARDKKGSADAQH